MPFFECYGGPFDGEVHYIPAAESNMRRLKTGLRFRMYHELPNGSTLGAMYLAKSDNPKALFVSMLVVKKPHGESNAQK